MVTIRNAAVLLLCFVSFQASAQVSDSRACTLKTYRQVPGRPDKPDVPLCYASRNDGVEERVDFATVDGANIGINNKAAELLGIMEQKISEAKQAVLNDVNAPTSALNVEIDHTRQACQESARKLPQLLIEDQRFKDLLKKLIKEVLAEK